MRLSVREARIADATNIAAVHASSWRHTYAGLLPGRYLARLEPDRLQVRWTRRLRAERRGGVHVIEDDRTGVFGFSVLGPCRDASLLGFAGEIQMLYLEPARMGCGFGSRLWRASRDALERRGFRWLVVWVVAGNGLARRFYEHVGLRADGARRHDKFDHQWVEVIRYAAPLAPVVDFSSLFGNNFSA